MHLYYKGWCLYVCHYWNVQSLFVLQFWSYWITKGPFCLKLTCHSQLYFWIYICCSQFFPFQFESLSFSTSDCSIQFLPLPKAQKIGCRKWPYLRVCIKISCGRVVRDFASEAKTRCNFQFRWARRHWFYEIFKNDNVQGLRSKFRKVVIDPLFFWQKIYIGLLFYQ